MFLGTDLPLYGNMSTERYRTTFTVFLFLSDTALISHRCSCVSPSAAGASSVSEQRTMVSVDGGRGAGLDFEQIFTISWVMEFTENRRRHPAFG